MLNRNETHRNGNPVSQASAESGIQPPTYLTDDVDESRSCWTESFKRDWHWGGSATWPLDVMRRVLPRHQQSALKHGGSDAMASK